MTANTHTEHADSERLETARRTAALRPSPEQDEIAARLQARTHGRWLCWYGHTTGRYWAIRKPSGPYRLVEGATPKDLAIAMGDADAYYRGQR